MVGALFCLFKYLRLVSFEKKKYIFEKQTQCFDFLKFSKNQKQKKNS